MYIFFIHFSILVNLSININKCLYTKIQNIYTCDFVIKLTNNKNYEIVKFEIILLIL
jgi:hypothetical protein